MSSTTSHIGDIHSSDDEFVEIDILTSANDTETSKDEVTKHPQKEDTNIGSLATEFVELDISTPANELEALKNQVAQLQKKDDSNKIMTKCITQHVFQMLAKVENLQIELAGSKNISAGKSDQLNSCLSKIKMLEDKLVMHRRSFVGICIVTEGLTSQLKAKINQLEAKRNECATLSEQVDKLQDKLDHAKEIVLQFMELVEDMEAQAPDLDQYMEVNGKLRVENHELKMEKRELRMEIYVLKKEIDDGESRIRCAYDRFDEAKEHAQRDKARADMAEELKADMDHDVERLSKEIHDLRATNDALMYHNKQIVGQNNHLEVGNRAYLGAQSLLSERVTRLEDQLLLSNNISSSQAGFIQAEEKRMAWLLETMGITREQLDTFISQQEQQEY